MREVLLTCASSVMTQERLALQMQKPKIIIPLHSLSNLNYQETNTGNLSTQRLKRNKEVRLVSLFQQPSKRAKQRIVRSCPVKLPAPRNVGDIIQTEIQTLTQTQPNMITLREGTLCSQNQRSIT